jgi:hypothetical protein
MSFHCSNSQGSRQAIQTDSGLPKGHIFHYILLRIGCSPTFSGCRSPSRYISKQGRVKWLQIRPRFRNTCVKEMFGLRDEVLELALGFVSAFRWMVWWILSSKPSRSTSASFASVSSSSQSRFRHFSHLYAFSGSFNQREIAVTSSLVARSSKYFRSVL